MAISEGLAAQRNHPERRLMTPDRWRAVKDVFDNAVELEGPARSRLSGAGVLATTRPCATKSRRCSRPTASSGTFMDRPAAAMRACRDSRRGARAASRRTHAGAVQHRVGDRRRRDGAIYRAEDTRLGRTVALKVLAAGVARRVARHGHGSNGRRGWRRRSTTRTSARSTR